MRSHDDAPGRGQFGPDRVSPPVDALREVLTQAATERALDAADQYLGTSEVNNLPLNQHLDLQEEILAVVRRRLATPLPDPAERRSADMAALGDRLRLAARMKIEPETAVVDLLIEAADALAAAGGDEK